MEFFRGQSFSSKDFDQLSLHDSHIHAVRWSHDGHSLTLDLDFIACWEEHSTGFQFTVAPAELCFEYADQVRIELEWNKGISVAQIDTLERHSPSLAPDGESLEFIWSLELSQPAGGISLRATDFRLTLLEVPVRTSSQSLR